MPKSGTENQKSRYFYETMDTTHKKLYSIHFVVLLLPMLIRERLTVRQNNFRLMLQHFQSKRLSGWSWQKNLVVRWRWESIVNTSLSIPSNCWNCPLNYWLYGSLYLSSWGHSRLSCDYIWIDLNLRIFHLYKYDCCTKSIDPGIHNWH